jgi:3D (Asp-Asp-Asp) domain-containing protein
VVDDNNGRAERRRTQERNTEVTKPVKTEEFIITAYCCENYPHICNDGEAIYTATGTVATAGRTIAVDPKIVPYGTSVEIEGVGVRVAEDCGGAIKGNRIDLLFETHEEALNFGIQTRQVTIVE